MDGEEKKRAQFTISTVENKQNLILETKKKSNEKLNKALVVHRSSFNGYLLYARIRTSIDDRSLKSYFVFTLMSHILESNNEVMNWKQQQNQTN